MPRGNDILVKGKGCSGGRGDERNEGEVIEFATECAVDDERGKRERVYM